MRLEWFEIAAQRHDAICKEAFAVPLVAAGARMVPRLLPKLLKPKNLLAATTVASTGADVAKQTSKAMRVGSQTKGMWGQMAHVPNNVTY